MYMTIRNCETIVSDFQNSRFPFYFLALLFAVEGMSHEDEEHAMPPFDNANEAWGCGITTGDDNLHLPLVLFPPTFRFTSEHLAHSKLDRRKPLQVWKDIQVRIETSVLVENEEARDVHSLHRESNITVQA